MKVLLFNPFFPSHKITDYQAHNESLERHKLSYTFVADPFIMKTRIFFAFVFGLLCISAQAQDQIILRNGASLDCKVLNAGDYEIKYEVTKKSGKKKHRYIEREMVFSVLREGEAEQIFYEKNPDNGDYFEIDQMRKFIYGAQDAQEQYKARLPMAIGFGLGAVGGFFTGGSILFVTVPFAATMIAVIPPVHPHNRQVRDKNLINDPSYVLGYVLGYERTARNKKIMHALIGSAIGTAAGVITYNVLPGTE